jgi:hypothetical protein
MLMDPKYSNFSRFWLGSLTSKGEFVPELKMIGFVGFNTYDNDLPVFTKPSQTIAGPGMEDVEDTDGILKAAMQFLLDNGVRRERAMEELAPVRRLDQNYRTVANGIAFRFNWPDAKVDWKRGVKNNSVIVGMPSSNPGLVTDVKEGESHDGGSSAADRKDESRSVVYMLSQISLKD